MQQNVLGKGDKLYSYETLGAPVDQKINEVERDNLVVKITEIPKQEQPESLTYRALYICRSVPQINLSTCNSY